jgi:hypothetical protein
MPEFIDYLWVYYLFYNFDCFVDSFVRDSVCDHRGALLVVRDFDLDHLYVELVP